MKLVSSLLLGSAASFVVVAGASAADLPSKKAAPVNFVKVCDAYGAGFFYLPGTETCVKVGGRVRTDFAGSAPQSVYSAAGATVGAADTVSAAKDAAASWGWEARGRVDLDARTATPYGTVQAVASLRLARSSGVLSEVGPALSSNSAAATLEAAYIRYAGFTFGAARDNFSFMPSTFYGAGHWSSFANGAKQLAYTAVLGGGVSATVALQDPNDTVFAPSTIGASGSPAFSYNRLPQINARVDYDQAWGSASVMGAVGFANGVSANASTYDESKTTYALGAGVKVNLPMIAAGDVLYLNGAYAQGMQEYRVGWTYFKSSDVKRNVGGYVAKDVSYVYGANGVELPKSWGLAGLLTHYWDPQWRHSFVASGGKVDATASQKATVFNATTAYGDALVWNVGTQLAFIPTKDFEIGVDVLYARVEQDVRRSSTLVTKEKEGNVTGRLRVERTF